jgi:hypothetical protein
MIRQLRLIAYHPTLRLWCGVVCIGGIGDIGVLLEVYLQ